MHYLNKKKTYRVQQIVDILQKDGIESQLGIVENKHDGLIPSKKKQQDVNATSVPATSSTSLTDSCLRITLKQGFNSKGETSRQQSSRASLRCSSS